MFRIDNATSQASPPTYPSAGTPGHFTKGNPGSGVASTVLDDWWVDQVQEEICNVVGATGITLAKGTNTQLRDSILAFIGGNTGTLSFSSTTALLFKPKGQGYLRVAGTAVAIPTAGLSIANTGVEVNGTGSSNLAASTTYDLYLKNSGGTLVPSFYTDTGGGTHMVDTTAGNIGTEVRSNSGTPDSTRSLIGKIRTDGSSHFVDSAASRFVLSWFNRRTRGLLASASGLTSANAASLAELSTSMRCSFLTWGDEDVSGQCDGCGSNDTGSQSVGFQIAVDASLAGSLNQYFSLTASGAFSFSSSFNGFLSEGVHTVSPYANMSGGTTTFNQIYNRVRIVG
jgi:hypothetical protein